MQSTEWPERHLHLPRKTSFLWRHMSRQTQIQERILDFPDERGATPKGTNLLFGQNFLIIVWKWTKMNNYVDPPMRLKDSQSRNLFLWNITTGIKVSLPVTSTSTSALTLPLLYPTRNRHFVLIPKLISLLSVARYGSINPLQFNHPRYNSISGDTTTCRSICDNLR